jgi:hypothetical protein
MSGGSPRLLEYCLFLLTMVATVGAASLIREGVHPSLGFLALVVWLGFAAFAGPADFQSLALFARIALAMSFCLLLVRVERAAEPQYGAA